MKQKVLLATPLYPPDIGGPATYTVLLETELPKLGLEVEVVSFGGSRVWPKPFSHLHYLIRLCWRARGCQLIFAQDPVSVGLPALVTAKLFGKKFVIRMPGDYAWEQSTQRYGVSDGIDAFQSKQYGWRVEFLRWWQNLVTKRADLVITPSEYFRQLVIGWGINPEKVHTVYNGIDLDLKPTSVAKPGVRTLVTVGRLVPWKGIKELLAVMSQLPKWQLWIIGDGPELSDLKAAVAAADLRDRVKFLGTQSRSQMLGYCEAADAFVLNTYFESFSFQVAEMMALGKPIITTNVGSLPELIDDYREGLLLTPGDTAAFVKAVESLSEEPDLWRERVAAARLKVRKFSIDNTVKQTFDLVNKLLS